MRGKAVLRAAYGTYADRPFQGLWDFGVLNYPFATSLSVFNLPFQLRDLPIARSADADAVDRPGAAESVDASLQCHARAPARSHGPASARAMSARAATASIDSSSRTRRPKCRRIVVPIRDSRARGCSTNASSSDYDALQVVARQRAVARPRPHGRLHLRARA